MADHNTDELYILLENILNDEVPQSPREAVVARVIAGRHRVSDFDEVTRQLTIARDHIENANPLNWRDALRQSVDLGMHLFNGGSFAEAVPVLERAHEVLDKYFGTQNHGATVLVRTIERSRTLAERKAAGTCCGCGGCARK